MPKQITRYQCDFCNRTYANKSPTVKHEKICLKNPANKSCSTCFNAINDIEPLCAVTGKKIFAKARAVKHCENWAENWVEEDF